MTQILFAGLYLLILLVLALIVAWEYRRKSRACRVDWGIEEPTPSRIFKKDLPNRYH